MVDSLYTPRYLNRLVQRIVPAPKFFLDRYFPRKDRSTTAEVYFDVEDGTYDIAPFVHPMNEAKLLTSQGYKTKSFTPAYVKQKANLTPDKAFSRLAGESFEGDYSPEQRAAMHLTKLTTRLVEGLQNRMEVMACEAAKTGKLTIQGDGIDAVLDFGRDPSLTRKLEGENTWANKNLGMTAFIEDVKRKVASKSNKQTRPTDMILGTEAFDAFIANKELRELASSLLRGADSSVQLTPGPQAENVVFKGRFGDMNIFVHEAKYREKGTEKFFVEPKEALFMAKSIDGWQQYGAIQDLDSLRATDMFMKSWKEEDPSVRVILLQSAPLVVPYDVNAGCLITVL